MVFSDMAMATSTQKRRRTVPAFQAGGLEELLPFGDNVYLQALNHMLAASWLPPELQRLFKRPLPEPAVNPAKKPLETITSFPRLDLASVSCSMVPASYGKEEGLAEALRFTSCLELAAQHMPFHHAPEQFGLYISSRSILQLASRASAMKPGLPWREAVVAAAGFHVEAALAGLCFECAVSRLEVLLGKAIFHLRKEADGRVAILGTQEYRKLRGLNRIDAWASMSSQVAVDAVKDAVESKFLRPSPKLIPPLTRELEEASRLLASLLPEVGGRSIDTKAFSKEADLFEPCGGWRERVFLTGGLDAAKRLPFKMETPNA